MNIMHKLAEDAIGTILAGSDDWIDDNQYHDFEGDYDWSDDDICTLYFRVDGKRIGSWDIDIADIEDLMVLDDISAEVEAAVSGMHDSESRVTERYVEADDFVEEDLLVRSPDGKLTTNTSSGRWGNSKEWNYNNAHNKENEDLLVRGADGKLTTNSNSNRWGNSKEWNYNNDHGNKKESIIGPNAYKYIFKAYNKSYWDDLSWSDVKYYDGKPCRVTDTPVVGPDFKSRYYDIEFEDGTELSGISGIHLLKAEKERNPYSTESADRGATNQYAVNYSLGDVVRFIHPGGKLSAETAVIIGYDDDGFYKVKWSDGDESDGLNDKNLKIVSKNQEPHEKVTESLFHNLQKTDKLPNSGRTWIRFIYDDNSREYLVYDSAEAAESDYNLIVDKYKEGEIVDDRLHQISLGFTTTNGRENIRWQDYVDMIEYTS